MRTRACTKCGEEKPLNDEYFYKGKQSKDGFRGVCKSCQSRNMKIYAMKNKDKIKKYGEVYREENKERIKEKDRKYYKENREKILEYQEKYYKDNAEYVKSRQSGYYEKNKDNIKAYNREYVEKNREHIQSYKQKYYEQNKERIMKHHKKYKEENPHIFRQINQRRKARKNKLPNTLTVEEWNYAKRYFSKSCAYCGITEEEHLDTYNEILHQEHFIPLSKGGEYTHNNIIPSCRICNTSKRDKDFFEWYPKYKHYSKQRENKILKFLNYKGDTQQLALTK